MASFRATPQLGRLSLLLATRGPARRVFFTPFFSRPESTNLECVGHTLKCFSPHICSYPMFHDYSQLKTVQLIMWFLILPGGLRRWQRPKMHQFPGFGGVTAHEFLILPPSLPSEDGTSENHGRGRCSGGCGWCDDPTMASLSGARAVAVGLMAVVVEIAPPGAVYKRRSWTQEQVGRGEQNE